MESKIIKLTENRVEQWLPGAEWWGKWGDAGEWVQTLNYKMRKFQGSNKWTTWC